MNCRYCDHDFEPEDTHGQCPQCQADIRQAEPFLGADDDEEQSDRQREWRSGSSNAQRANVLNARKTLDYLRAHPEGATKAQIRAAGIAPSLDLLEKHGLAYWNRSSMVQKRPHESAVWFVTGRKFPLIRK